MCVCVYSRKYVYSHANYNNLGKLVSGGNIDGINTYNTVMHIDLNMHIDMHIVLFSSV